MAGWITVPPIVRLTEAEYDGAVKTFMANMKERGTKRADEASEIAGESVRNGDTEKFIYRYVELGNVVAPLAIVTGNLGTGCYVVDCIASDPSAEGAGGIMMEFIVNHSETLGAGGVVELAPVTKDGEAVYRAWGFEYYNALRKNIDMRLYPDRSAAKWTRVAGRWRLAKYAAMRHFAV